MNDEGKLKSLLQDGMGENFFLNCNFKFDTSGVRFSPDERCVNESNLHQRSGNFFKADSCEISMSYRPLPQQSIHLPSNSRDSG